MRMPLLTVPRTTPFDVSTSKNSGPFMRPAATAGARPDAVPPVCASTVARIPPPTAAAPARAAFTISRRASRIIPPLPGRAVPDTGGGINASAGLVPLRGVPVRELHDDEEQQERDCFDGDQDHLTPCLPGLVSRDG